MRKFYFLFLLTIVALSCDTSEKDQYEKIMLVFPEASVKHNELTRFITAYILKKNKLEGIPPDLAIDAADTLMKLFLGGIPTSGTLTVKRDTLTYESLSIYNPFVAGDNTIKVPIVDITDVVVEDYYSTKFEKYNPLSPAVYKAVVVTTKNGKISYVLAREYFGTKQYDVIAEKVREFAKLNSL